MARTLIGEVELRLRDSLTPGAKKAAEALRGVKGAADALGSTKRLDTLSSGLRDATAQAQALARAMAGAKWGQDFNNQLARMRVSPDEIARLRREFDALNKQMATASTADRRGAIANWKATALQAVNDIRSAERALTKEAIDAARQRAVAEKQHAREIAQEKARQARDAAQQARQDARDARAAARQAASEDRALARDVARERIQAAREAAAAARAASREEIRAARDAAAAQRAAHRDAREARMPFMRAAGSVASGIGMAVGVSSATSGIARGARFAMDATAEESSVRTQMRLAGMTPQEIAQVEQRAGELSQQYRTLNRSHLMQLGQSLRSATGDVPKAIQMMETFAQMSSVMRGVRGSHDPQRDLEQFGKALDVLGATTNVGEFQAAAHAALRAHAVERRDLPLSEYLTFARRSKGTAQQLVGGDFFASYLPNLLQQAGGNSVGTAWHSLTSQLIGGRGTAKSGQVRRESGLADANGGVLDPALLAREPHLWAQRHMVPALNREFARAGVLERAANGTVQQWRWGQEMTSAQTTAMMQFLSRAFSNGKAGEFFNILLGQSEQLEKAAQMYRSSPGANAARDLTERDLRSAATSVTEQSRNLAATILRPIEGPLTSTLDALARKINDINNGAAGWSNVDKAAAAIGGLSLAAGTAVGSVLALKRLLTTLIPVSAAPGAAAAASGGGAVAGAAAGGAAGAAASMLRWLPRAGAYTTAAYLAYKGLEAIREGNERDFAGVADGQQHDRGRNMRRRANALYRDHGGDNAGRRPLGAPATSFDAMTGGGFGSASDGGFADWQRVNPSPGATLSDFERVMQGAAGRNPRRVWSSRHGRYVSVAPNPFSQPPEQNIRPVTDPNAMPTGGMFMDPRTLPSISTLPGGPANYATGGVSAAEQANLAMAQITANAQAAAASLGPSVEQGLVGGIQRAGPQAEAAFSSIMERLRSQASAGIDLPVRVTQTGGAAPAAAPSPPGRALGGPVTAGRLYEVGENNRSEWFIPGANGSIIPNHASGGLGGRSQRINVALGGITINGGNASDIAEQIADQLKTALAGAFSDGDETWG